MLIIDAIQSANKEQVRELVEQGQNVNQFTDEGTLLVGETDDLDFLKFLITEMGADINLNDERDGWTLLHLAALGRIDKQNSCLS